MFSADHRREALLLPALRSRALVLPFLERLHELAELLRLLPRAERRAGAWGQLGLLVRLL
jgi:hypothetical protein